MSKENYFKYATLYLKRSIFQRHENCDVFTNSMKRGFVAHHILCNRKTDVASLNGS